jgi:hypothetical protein
MTYICPKCKKTMRVRYRVWSKSLERYIEVCVKCEMKFPIKKP